jgi:hypothetical protein
MGLYGSRLEAKLEHGRPDALCAVLLILAPGFTWAGVAILFRGRDDAASGVLTEEGKGHNHRICDSERGDLSLACCCE